MCGETKATQRRSFQAVRSSLLCMAACAVCCLLATWRSYAHSDSLTLLDATVCGDEGALSLQVPLVRLAPREKPSTQWITYTRGQNSWETEDGGGKVLLKYWMSQLPKLGCQGGTVAGFGYWKGHWQSNSRPGPFIVMYVPVWFAIAAAFLLSTAIVRFRFQFTVATMLMVMTCFGCLLWLLLLRAPG